jgi:hypothetical protein
MTLGRDPRRIALSVAVVLLIGAMAFGLWHVVIGGLVQGNPRAAAFGVVLATAAGSVLTGALGALRGRPSR